eukprot:scaffold2299_cov131-Cylindrotheca_fusiformis.AAC.47
MDFSSTWISIVYDWRTPLSVCMLTASKILHRAEAYNAVPKKRELGSAASGIAHRGASNLESLTQIPQHVARNAKVIGFSSRKPNVEDTRASEENRGAGSERLVAHF